MAILFTLQDNRFRHPCNPLGRMPFVHAPARRSALPGQDRNDSRLEQSNALRSGAVDN
jgi:hypothetical protein